MLKTRLTGNVDRLAQVTLRLCTEPLVLLSVVDFIQNAGTILGVDWSGRVVLTGKNVTSPKVGDHVAGCTQGGTYVDTGAFVEYVRVPAELSVVIPEGTLSHEEAATLSCG